MDSRSYKGQLFLAPAKTGSLPPDVLLRALALAEKDSGEAICPEASMFPHDLSEHMGGSCTHDSMHDICPNVTGSNCPCDSANSLNASLGAAFAGETLDPVAGNEDECANGRQVNSTTLLGCGEGEEDEHLQEQDGPLQRWAHPQDCWNSIEMDEPTSQPAEPAAGSTTVTPAVPSRATATAVARAHWCMVWAEECKSRQKRGKLLAPARLLRRRSRTSQTLRGWSASCLKSRTEQWRS